MPTRRGNHDTRQPQARGKSVALASGANSQREDGDGAAGLRRFPRRHSRAQSPAELHGGRLCRNRHRARSRRLTARVDGRCADHSIQSSPADRSKTMRARRDSGPACADLGEEDWRIGSVEELAEAGFENPWGTARVSRLTRYVAQEDPRATGLQHAHTLHARAGGVISAEALSRVRPAGESSWGNPGPA